LPWKKRNNYSLNVLFRYGSRVAFEDSGIMGMIKVTVSILESYHKLTSPSLSVGLWRKLGRYSAMGSTKSKTKDKEDHP